MSRAVLWGALQPVVAAFDRLQIPYLVGGSVASTVYGMARTTLDVDLVADIPKGSVPELIKLLGSSFYADSAMIREGDIQWGHTTAILIRDEAGSPDHMVVIVENVGKAS